MNKFKMSDVGTVKIIDKETNKVIFEQTMNFNDHKLDDFFSEYYIAKESSNYEENKDVIRNYLIKNYFL